MSLAQALQEYIGQSNIKIPEDKRALMTQATSALRESDIIDQALKTGDMMPDFTLPDATGQSVTLSKILTNGPVILTVYRGGWCPYCNLELKAYQNALSDINDAGAQLIALSPEKPDDTLSTSQKNELAFTVLSDHDHSVLRQMGLVFEMPDYLAELYSQFGLHVDAANGTTGKFELPLAATYVIAPDHTIKHAFLDVDYRNRMEPREVVEVLRGV